jgi:hypothetical protein
MLTKMVDGKLMMESETDAERLALIYLDDHRPIFAVAEEYMVRAFVAGYEAAQAEHAKSEKP